MGANISNEELIVRYLLGELPEDEMAEIEDRAFRDKQYLQEILAVESDLIDEYVQGGLSNSRRQMFANRFLASAERRQKVEFAKALASVLSETIVTEKKSQPAIAQVSLWSSFAALFRGFSPAVRFSFATAALLIVIGGIWVVIEAVRLRSQVTQLRAEQQRDQQALEDQLADERARNETLSDQLRSEREQHERSEELIRELEREKEAQATKPIEPAVISLVLLPGIGRGGSERQKLILPQSVRLVRLQIGIEPGDEYKSFSVELHAPGGETVWTQNNLSARTVRAGRVVVLNLPARLLSAGRYELALKGVTDGGTTEAVGFYYFDAVKK